MKKILFLLPFLILSCKKESAEVQQNNMDSTQVVTQENTVEAVDSVPETDSAISSSPVVKEVLREGVNRETEGKKIIRNAIAEQLPFQIGEEFTEDGQEFILKIQNFSNSEISASIIPDHDMQNIRINQIRLPNGETDGPFGREIFSYRIPQKGEVWLVIGKSNMASGETKGRFSVAVE